MVACPPRAVNGPFTILLVNGVGVILREPCAYCSTTCVSIAGSSCSLWLLATINQVFSLLDPLIFRHIIDQLRDAIPANTRPASSSAACLLLCAAVGVAFVSRVAKNFQDYCVNVITQRLGAQLYSDGIRHSLALPYSVFEDQRSGETLGKLQKVRIGFREAHDGRRQRRLHDDRRHRLRRDLRLEGSLGDRAASLLTVPLLGVLSSVLSQRIKRSRRSSSPRPPRSPGSTTESLRNIELVKSLGLASRKSID